MAKAKESTEKKAKTASKKTKAPAAKAKKGGVAQSKGKKTKEKVAAKPKRPEVPPRLFLKYNKEIRAALMKDLDFKNPMQVPRLSKISLNMGLGEAVANPNIIKTAVEELSQIAGQRAVVTRARKSIANFKLRTGLAIGCRVTLRRERMWEFFDRFVNVAIPRVRDFKGVNSKAFDGRGNYSMGVREQIIFPEINYDKVDKVKGFNVTIATTAKNDKEAIVLLKHLGMPFRN